MRMNHKRYILQDVDLDGVERQIRENQLPFEDPNAGLFIQAEEDLPETHFHLKKVSINFASCLCSYLKYPLHFLEE